MNPATLRRWGLVQTLVWVVPRVLWAQGGAAEPANPAEPLPCAGARLERPLVFQFQQPAASGVAGPDRWVLVREVLGREETRQALPVEAEGPDSGGVRSARVEGFSGLYRWRVVLYAVRGETWSPPSNALEIPATVRACGPPENRAPQLLLANPAGAA